MDRTCINVGVCTYGRMHLWQTLTSLKFQDLPAGMSMRVIVADNDSTQSSKDMVEKAVAELGLDIVYLHAPAFNISIARNSILDAVEGPFLAFIDDDEEAEVDWLSHLFKSLVNTNATAVFGPVRAIYRDGAPGWLVRGDFHSAALSEVGGQFVTGYTSNAMIRTDAPELAGLRFRVDLGVCGGEDNFFFSALHARGGILGFEPMAVVTEYVPRARESLKWLAARRFRSGQTHARLTTARGFYSVIKTSFQVPFKIAYCTIRTATGAMSSVEWRRWLLRGALHAGVLSKLLGIKELKLYERKATQTSQPAIPAKIGSS